MLPGRQYTPEEILRRLWCRKWVVSAVMLVCTVTTVIAAYQIPNQYKSETMILVIPQRVPESYVRSTVTTRIEERLRSINEQIQSRSRLEKVITDFDLYTDLRKTMPMEQIVERMRPDITVDAIREDAFKVSFIGPTARTAMIVADRLAAMVLAENQLDREVMANGTNDFLESQLQDARRRLVEHEKKLEDFRRRYSGELPSQVESNLQVIRNTQNQIQSLNESIDRDRDRRLVLERAANDASTPGAPSAADAASGDSSALRSIDQLERARGELHTMELRLKPGHPDISAKKRAIAELQQRVEDENTAAGQGAPPASSSASADLVRQVRGRQTQSEIAKLDKQIAVKEAEIERLKGVSIDHQRRVDSVPGHESELTALMRDYDTLQKIYASLLGKKEDSKISANLERQQVGEQFRILDPARLPERHYSPNRLRWGLISLVGGLVLGLALAAFLEYRDTTLRTEDEIVKMLVLPVVAAIPMLLSISDRKRRRRNIALTVTGSLLLVVGGTLGVLWKLNLLQGLR